MITIKRYKQAREYKLEIVESNSELRINILNTITLGEITLHDDIANIVKRLTITANSSVLFNFIRTLYNMDIYHISAVLNYTKSDITLIQDFSATDSNIRFLTTKNSNFITIELSIDDRLSIYQILYTKADKLSALLYNNPENISSSIKRISDILEF